MWLSAASALLIVSSARSERILRSSKCPRWFEADRCKNLTVLASSAYVVMETSYRAAIEFGMWVDLSG